MNKQIIKLNSIIKSKEEFKARVVVSILANIIKQTKIPKDVKIIKFNKARSFIIKNAGKLFFTVLFIKKDNSLRKMNCRLGVKKNLKGVGHKFDLKEKNLICVYDISKQDYRMINVNTLLFFKLKGINYVVDHW